jgi:HrpA-like RNA helicase
VDIFENFFNTNLANPICSVISLETRSYPVSEYFLKDPCSDYISEIVQVVLQIHQNEGPGDILVFAPGKEEVETILSLIGDRSNKYIAYDIVIVCN